MPNFTTCEAEFVTHINGAYAPYRYNGSIGVGIDHSNRPPLITYEGCNALCGAGSQLYDWATASTTITTWVLPILGIVVQAPFESNEAIKTLLALLRWIGSPIASLTYLFWNIHVIRKSALLVDMAVSYDDFPGEDTRFADFRNAMYILSSMNQYTFGARLEPYELERYEKLIRHALFSNQKLAQSKDERLATLVQYRKVVARRLRERRKKGIIPVFVSQGWFMFSLAISIQGAFGQLGDNTTAHDLAMGLLLCWLPVFFLAATVDRNPTGTERVRKNLNNLLKETANALAKADLDRQTMEFKWVPNMNNEEFFLKYAGQGRKRWHYGVADPVISALEHHLIASKLGRNWLSEIYPQRADEVNGFLSDRFEAGSLREFDFREVWQLSAAFIIVMSSTLGALVVSYFTPTVGLGCRSGSYVLFVVLAGSSFVMEVTAWWALAKDRSSNRVAKVCTYVFDIFVGSPAKIGYCVAVATWKLVTTGRLLKELPNFNDVATTEQWWSWSFFIPLDVFNTAWLGFIMLAQTFGFFRNCLCMSAVWSGAGYIDFQSVYYYRDHGILFYWTTGTSIVCPVLIIATLYLVMQWATQSHLNTENYEDAMDGLRHTRRFKKYTVWLRIIAGVFLTSLEPGGAIRTILSWITYGAVSAGVFEPSRLSWRWKDKTGSSRHIRHRSRGRRPVAIYLRHGSEKELLPMREDMRSYSISSFASASTTPGLPSPGSFPTIHVSPPTKD